MERNSKAKERYIIDVEYGSKWQRGLYEKMIGLVLSSTKKHMEDRHKKNKFTFTKA